MTDTNQPKTDVGAAAALALQAAGIVPVDVLEINGLSYVFTVQEDHNGKKTVQREVLLPRDHHGNVLAKPERIAQAVTVETQDSLIDYVRDFKLPGTRLFASISVNAIVAVLDFHEGRTTATLDMMNAEETANVVDPAANPDFGGDAHFGQHVASLKLPYSEEWETWGKADGKMVDQVAFARFIQENAPDIVTPDAADVLEVVRDLRGARAVKFTGEVNMNSNNDSFEYEDRTTVGRKDSLDIPDAFSIRIPVYFGGELVGLQAQLRHEVTPEGKLLLGIKLLRRESVRQATFKALVQDVAAQTGCPVVYGQRGSLTTLGQGPDF